MSGMRIRPATEADVPLIRAFIEALADYERLRHECRATDEALRETLFGVQPGAEEHPRLCRCAGCRGAA